MDAAAEPSQALVEVVYRIAAAAERLETALRLEHDALIGNDDQALDATGRDKDALVRTLEALEGERQRIGRRLGISLGPAPMRAALAGQPEARDRWAACLAVLERCQAINAGNGRIVESKLHHVRAALDLISGRLPGSATYGPTGQTAPARLRTSIAKV